MTRRVTTWILTGAVLAACGCGGGPIVPGDVPSPAPLGSAEPNLFASDGKLYLSWLRHDEDHHVFQFAVLENEIWSEPRTIAEGDSFFANWADFPSLVRLADGTLAAHWLWKTGEGPYAYSVRVARSTDGQVWSQGRPPHGDGTPTEHGFVSLLPLDTGAAVVWLDGRDFAGAGHGMDAGSMQLRSTELASNGFQEEIVLDPRVCDCCGTAAVRTSKGLLVAYRDRSDDEVRDISLVRREDATWTKPYPLAEDGWLISGCPVNGPALAADKADVVAAWFTMADDSARVEFARSQDDGQTFSSPVVIDEGSPLGRVDVVLLPSGDALVVWLEGKGGGRGEVRARRIRQDGTLDESFLVASTGSGRASGFPHVALTNGKLYFAWTTEGDPTTVRLATLPLPRSWR